MDMGSIDQRRVGIGDDSGLLFTLLLLRDGASGTRGVDSEWTCKLGGQ